MAKKVVATIQDKSGRKFTRCIKMVKEGKNGSYTFKDEMVVNEKINDFFA
ncbi:MAG: DUF4295 domain-containing protein [bacterium]